MQQDIRIAKVPVTKRVIANTPRGEGGLECHVYFAGQAGGFRVSQCTHAGKRNAGRTVTPSKRELAAGAVAEIGPVIVVSRELPEAAR